MLYLFLASLAAVIGFSKSARTYLVSILLTTLKGLLHSDPNDPVSC